MTRPSSCMLDGRDKVEHLLVAHEVVDEMPTRTHPHIARDLEIEMAQALSRDEAAIRRTAGEMGAPRAEQDPLDRRVDAIRTDKRIDEDQLPVLELGLDGVAAFHEAHEAVPDVNALRWQRPEQDGQ